MTDTVASKTMKTIKTIGATDDHGNLSAVLARRDHGPDNTDNGSIGYFKTYYLLRKCYSKCFRRHRQDHPIRKKRE